MNGFESSVVQLLVKVTFVFACGWLAHAALAKWNPRWRVLNWRITAVSVVAVLGTAALPPIYDLPVIPAANDQQMGNIKNEFIGPIRLFRRRQTIAIANSKDAEGVVTADRIRTPLPLETDSPAVTLPNEQEPIASSVALSSDLDDQKITPPETEPYDVAASAPQANWRLIMVVAYAAVAGLLIVRLVIGQWMTYCACRAAWPAPDWVRQIASQTVRGTGSLDLPIRITEQFQTPLLCGVIRQTILLPRSLVESPSAEWDVRAAVAHEASHAANRDLTWDLLIAALTACFWPHPLVWRLRTAHRVACERVSDRVAVDSLGDLPGYQSLVARIALHVSGARVDVGIAMARCSEVRQRLSSLANCPCATQLGRRASLLGLIMMIAASLFGLGSLLTMPAQADSIATESANDQPSDSKQTPPAEAPEKTKSSTELQPDAPPRPAPPANPQVESEARFQIILPEAANIIHDLQWLIEQSPTDDLVKQWQKLNDDVLGAFTPGVDLSRPIRMDLVLRKGKLECDFRIPSFDLTGKNGLLNNIAGAGYRVTAIDKDRFYRFSEKKEAPYFLRYENDYAWMSRDKEAVPPNLPPADHDLDYLLDLNHDLTFKLANDVSGIDSRRASFREFRTHFDTIKRQRNERDSAFALRQVALKNRLDEVERFIAEADFVRVGWTTDSAAETGRGEISLSALPGTGLRASLEGFSVRPSHFANVTPHSDSILSGRMNFAIDAVRRQALREYFKTARPEFEAQIESDASRTDAQKTAGKKMMNRFLDMLTQGAALPALDAFVDMHSVAPEQNRLICGIRAANGKIIDEILKTLPESNSGWQVKRNIDQHGGVSIHKLTVPNEYVSVFLDLFSGETAIYIGAHADAVWIAAGTDALQGMKVAIDQAAKPPVSNADPAFVSYRFQVPKLFALTHFVLCGVLGVDANVPETAKAIAKHHTFIERTMGRDGLMNGELKRIDDRIEGFLEIDAHVVRYVGTVLADSVKQTID